MTDTLTPAQTQAMTTTDTLTPPGIHLTKHTPNF